MWKFGMNSKVWDTLNNQRTYGYKNKFTLNILVVHKIKEYVIVTLNL